MKITGYRTEVVSVPLDDPMVQANLGTYLVLHLETDEGVEGIYWNSRLGDVSTFLGTLKGYLDQLIGLDPTRIEAITAPQIKFGVPGIIFRKNAYQHRAAQMIDVALWDIRGKLAGQPVYKLMGGFRDRVPCYASWRIEPGTIHEKELGKSACYLVDQGFKSMKFHVRRMDHKQTVEHMRRLREAVGPDVDIMVDNFQGWTLKESIRMANALAPYDPYWIEDPISLDDYEGMRQLRDAVDTNICAGEQYRTLNQFRELLEHRSVDIAMVDLDLGMSGFLKVAHMAEAFEVPVVSHLATEAMAHCIAAVPNGLTVEYVPFANALFKEPLTIEDGEIVMPRGPGLGLELDEAALKKYALN